MFVIVHICVLRPTIVAHRTCVFPLLANDTHIVGPISNVLPFFLIIGGVWRIKTFNVIDELCRLVSTGVRLVYITSSRFSYN